MPIQNKKLNPFKSVDSYVSMALGLAVVLLVGALAFNFSSKKSSTEIGKNGEGTATESANANLPATYTVKAGDSLWSIAESYYHSGYNFVDIQKANNISNSDNIEAGQNLTIPDVKPIIVGDTSSAATEQVRPKDASYTVFQGDTLWGIAEKEYGTGFKWVDIANANHLINPDIIHSGNILTLP
jgi:nucleoid-associated protein YgaU